MTRKLILLLTVVVLAGAFVFYKLLMPSFRKTPTLREDVITKDSTQPLLATFDRRNDQPIANKYYNHILLQWSDFSPLADTKELSGLIENEEPLIVTVETWTSTKDPFLNSDDNVLQQIILGKYDNKIKQLGELLVAKKRAALVRFDPEMEVFVNQFPWQKQSPLSYIIAYRHFAEKLKAAAPKTSMIWSPAGYPGAEEYWPGAAFVDYIGVGVKTKSELQTTNYPEPRNQRILFERKIERMRFFEKPILVFGSERFSGKQFNQAEFDSAVAHIRRNEALLYKDAGIADKYEDSVFRQDKIVIGVFDPKLTLTGIKGISTEHVFVNLERLSSHAFHQMFDSVINRGHDVIVTMEPWKDKIVRADTNLLANILAGKYDQAFKTLLEVIKNNKGKKVYLRFLHEMEIPITRYPWQSQDPVMYIKAYRYFVNLLSPKPANIYMVWGPAGDRGSMEFWPGSDVVDYVSIAIYGLPDKNISDYTKQESFATIFNRKYRRIRMAHKPLFITEFGVKGPEDFKRQWMTDAARVIKENRVITGINYFNFEDNPKAWGDIKAPDWSTSPAVFNDFVKALNDSAH